MKDRIKNGVSKLRATVDRLKDLAAQHSDKIREALDKIAPAEGTLLRRRLRDRIREKIEDLKEKHGDLMTAVKAHVGKARELLDKIAPAAKEAAATPEQGTLLRARLREKIEKVKHVIGQIKAGVAKVKKIRDDIRETFAPAPVAEEGQQLRRRQDWRTHSVVVTTVDSNGVSRRERLATPGAPPQDQPVKKPLGHSRMKITPHAPMPVSLDQDNTKPKEEEPEDVGQELRRRTFHQ